MNRFAATTLFGLIGLLITLIPNAAQASNYEEAWAFTCAWECGEAMFEPEYGGYTVHGYAETYNEELPASEAQAADWAYVDYWKPAGCEAFSTTFSQIVCFDTAYLRGVEGWRDMAYRYWEYSDDELACAVLRERFQLHNDGSEYSEGWLNRDISLMEMGGC
jgi:hypothetical protein